VRVSTDTEVDVGDGQAGQFGDPQPRLGRQDEHRVVTPPGPGPPVGRGQERVDLLLCEPGDQLALQRLVGIASTRWIVAACSGCRKRGVAEQGVDRGEPVVAGPDLVTALVFEVIKERADQCASRSAMSSADGVFPVRVAAKASSSRNVSR